MLSEALNVELVQRVCRKSIAPDSTRLLPAAGTAPEVSADAIYTAVTEDDVRRVRYYAGPMQSSRRGPAINPTQFCYEFRAASHGRPSGRWQSLTSVTLTAARTRLPI